VSSPQEYLEKNLVTMNEKNGARSMKSQIIGGDSFAVTINFRWLLQIIAATAIVVYAFWKIEGRIQELERNMELAMEEITLHEQERLESQQKHVAKMEERMEWYEKELSINPFSWGKKK
jgi:hypothetical protein